LASQDDEVRLLLRFAAVGACPMCHGTLQTAPDDRRALICARCGTSVWEDSGFVVARPQNHAMQQTSTAPDARRTGWAAGIAADMDQKSSSYWSKYEHYSLKNRGFIIRRELALKLVGSQPGRVLEAGCGPGIVVPALAASGVDAHGVDLSAEQLKFAAARDSGSLYVQGDLERLPYRNGVFDTIVLLGVFEYLEAPEVVLRELARVAHPGSRLILSLPNARSVARVWTQYLYIPMARAVKRVVRRPVPDYSRTLYSLAKFQRLLEEAGFEIDTVRFFDLELTPPPIDRLALSGVIRMVDGLEARLTGWPRRVLASQFVVLSEARSQAVHDSSQAAQHGSE
jgi:2-polyprenyl-3-methyl-5-hydroxy-6-metoxy-1,4-benzoquinol methylase